MNSDHLGWLKKQLPELRQKEIIDAQSERRLVEHYQLDSVADKTTSGSLISIILAAFGGLLVGGGIILIFAHNWEQFGRGMRVVLAFMPLLLSQALAVYCIFARKNSPAWCETAGAFLFCCIPASISIIGQTYHISDDTQSFFTWWFVLALPFVYWLRAHLMALMMVVLGASLMINYQSPYWLCLFALAPYYALELHKGSGRRSLQFGWVFALAFAIATPFVIFDQSIVQFSFLSMASGAAVMYLGGARLEPIAVFRLKPFTNIGAVAMCVNALILTYDDVWRELLSHDVIGHAEVVTSAWHSLAFEWFLVAAALSLLALAIQRNDRRVLPLGSVVAVLTVVIALPDGFVNPTLMALLMNAIVVGIGIWFVYMGISGDSTSQLNLGLLLLMALLSSRFFDQDLTFIARGIAFIAMGITLIGMNVWQARRRVA